MEMGQPLSLVLWLSTFLGMSYTLDPVISDDHGPAQGPEHDLCRHILDKYKPDSRPVKNASDAVVVTFALSLNQLLDLEWTDELLVWSAEDFQNQRHLMIPASSIWLPDIFIFNAAGDTTNGFIHVNGSKVAINDHGQVAWMVPLMVNSACAVDVTYFPYDRQTCTIKFGSWIYDIHQLDIILDSSKPDLDHYVMNSEYDLENVSLTRGILDSSCCAGEGQHSMIELQLKLKRKSLFYDYIVIAPTIMLCVLTLASFLLPCDKGEKIAIGLTVFLTLYVLQLRIADNVPDTNSTPILGVFMLVVMTFNCVSLIMATVVMNIKKRGDISQCPEVPPWLFAFCERGIGPVVCTLWKNTIPIPLSLLEEVVEHETTFDGPETISDHPKHFGLPVKESFMTWSEGRGEGDNCPNDGVYSEALDFPQVNPRRHVELNSEDEARTTEISPIYHDELSVAYLEGDMDKDSGNLKMECQDREDCLKTHHPTIKKSINSSMQEKDLRNNLPDQTAGVSLSPSAENDESGRPHCHNNRILSGESLNRKRDTFSHIPRPENLEGLRQRKLAEKEQNPVPQDDERAGNGNLILALSPDNVMALKQARRTNLRKRQWFYVAEVIDKFAFFIYLVLLTISIFTVLFLIPVSFRNSHA